MSQCNEYKALFALCIYSEVRRRRGPQGLPEHGNKCTRRTVAGFESGVGNHLSLRQELHCPHETKLLPPLSEGDSYFVQEESLHRPLARTGHFAELLERT